MSAQDDQLGPRGDQRRRAQQRVAHGVEGVGVGQGVAEPANLGG